MTNRSSASPALRFCITTTPQRAVTATYLTRRILGNRRSTLRMSASTSGIATPAEDGAGPGLRKLKILMLHGYTQSGPLFHAKTRALEKILHKAFPSKPISPLFSSYPGGVQLFYPTAPLRLVPADIPGYNVEGPENGDLKEETDAWGWWKRETGSAVYSGLEEGLRTIRQTIEDAGGVDGVIGFSQGGCAAAFVASLLEPGRRGTFQEYKAKDASAFGYPEGWDELQKTNGELKFAVSYSGFYAPVDIYSGFYEPKIKTKFLSVIGSLDSVVEEHRSKGLVERTEGGRVVFHAGGHFVPVGKDMAGVVVGFIRECCLVKDDKEESVEDMDVPF